MSIMKWGEAVLWKEVDSGDALNPFISIHLFLGHIPSTRFYEEIWTVAQKVFSQFILFIDVLKCMQKKIGLLSASKSISYLRTMQWWGCSLVIWTIWILYLRDNPAVELMVVMATIRISFFKPLC